MTRPVRSVARHRRDQALAETSIMLTLAVFLTLGTIKLGRAWMIANVVTSAARDGARAAATLPLTDRFQGGAHAGQIDPTAKDWLAIAQQVKEVIASVYVDDTPPQVVLDPDALPWSPIKMISVTVVDDVEWLFLGSLLGERLHIARTITFRDDGR